MTTYTTKIAKNGTKMYYVRENGKLRRISAREARHAEYMNGVYKAIAERTAADTENVEKTEGEAAKAEPQCSWENPHNYETVGNLTHARNLYTAAQKANVYNESIAMLDAAVEDDCDVFSLLPKIEDLNDFDETDSWLIDDAAEYTDRDDRYNRGEKIAANLTAKLRPFDPTVEVTYTIEDDEDIYYLSYDGIICPPPFTATGVEASFHAMKQSEAKPEAPTDPEPKTADVKKVSAVVYYTCADDKSNWAKDKYFETTPAAAEWILSFVKTRVFDCTVRDAEIIDRRNGYVRYALTDADITAVNAVNTEPELPTPNPNSPFAIARGLDDVFRKTFHRVTAPYLDVTTQDGAKIATCFGDAYIEPDWQSDDGYVFTNGFDTFARYDTPEQVIDAMTALSDAIKRGETQFSFPTVEDLTPPEPELTDREKFLMASKVVTTEPGRHLGEDRFATKWVTLCPYKTISKATAGNILATFGLTSDAYLAEKAKWVADEIKRGSRQFAIDCQAEFLRDKTARDSKASVEPLPVFIPAEDREVDDELIDPPAITPVDNEISKQIAGTELSIRLAEVHINIINDKFLKSTACEMDDYDTYLIGKLQAQIAADKVKLAKLKASLEADKNVEPSATEKPTPRKKTTSRLSTAAQRYLNREKAREEAQERKVRREWQWEMEQRFYPN